MGLGAEPDDSNTAAEQLAGLLQTQDLVRRIVARMLHVQADDVDSAISDGLGSLGEHLNVDRAYVFVLEGETMRNTHEWCASGITAEIDNLQTVPVEAFAFWMDRLGAGDAVTVSDVLDVLSEFGCVAKCVMDINGDGSTNVTDVLLVLSAFGTACN